MYSTLSTVKTWRTQRVPARHLLILETQAKFAALLTSSGVCRLEPTSRSKFSLPLQPDLPRLITEADSSPAGQSLSFRPTKARSDSRGVARPYINRQTEDFRMRAFLLTACLACCVATFATGEASITHSPTARELTH